MFKFLEKLLTKKRTKIPLLYITFDYELYKQDKGKGYCNVYLHPCIKMNDEIDDLFKKIVDNIRANNDMEVI
jgi:hypothetical protein